MKSPNEKIFFLDNDHEVNRLVFKIGWIFMAVMLAMLTASYFDIFKVEPCDVLKVMLLLLVIQAVFFVLLKKKAPAGFVKYYGLIAIELCVISMISNAYFGIYISYILVPTISCLYFNKRLTSHVIAISYLGMMIGLWFRAPGAIELAFPGYTRVGWYIAFGIGYTLEYAAISAVLMAIARRTRRYMEELYHRNEKIHDIQDKIIYRFADLVESRDDNTGKHVKQTSKYVVMIANRLHSDGLFPDELNENMIVNLQLAAPLHDIGKIVVSDSILLKPGKLTPEEFKQMERHTVEGKKIIASAMEDIERVEFVDVAKQIALSHHEKWNGGGYPQGLSGEAIPLSARIMAVADVFDALVSERCYKKAMSVDAAFDEIKKESGTHFDPRVVDAFLSSKDDVLKILSEK